MTKKKSHMTVIFLAVLINVQVEPFEKLHEEYVFYVSVPSAGGYLKRESAKYHNSVCTRIMDCGFQRGIF